MGEHVGSEWQKVITPQILGTHEYHVEKKWYKNAFISLIPLPSNPPMDIDKYTEDIPKKIQ